MNRLAPLALAAILLAGCEPEIRLWPEPTPEDVKSDVLKDLRESARMEGKAFNIGNIQVDSISLFVDEIPALPSAYRTYSGWIYFSYDEHQENVPLQASITKLVELKFIVTGYAVEFSFNGPDRLIEIRDQARHRSSTR
jgi:hypothetical protein